MYKRQGPWVDDVRSGDYARNNKKLRLTKGVHVVIDQSKFPLGQAVYFLSLIHISEPTRH
ncbi:hypothetical protein JMUB7554_27640 [Staphylococcus aureus]